MVLKIKTRLIQDSTFIYLDPGHAKADKPRENEAKTKRSREGTWIKKCGESHFGYKLHSVIDRVYHLIRRFKTTTAECHDSYIDLSDENEVVYKYSGYFGAK